MKRPVLVLVLLIALAGIAWLTHSNIRPSSFRNEIPPAVEFKSFQSEAMYTTIEVVLPDRDGAEEAAEAVFGICRRVDARMSEWKDTSPLSDVNREAGKKAVHVPDDLRAVVRRGIAIGEATEGAFDITWAALWGLWNFKADAPRVPRDEEIQRNVANIDYTRVEIDDAAGTVGLPEAGMKIGLGGIAKGYALDCSAQVLRERGFENFMILTGGQVLVSGVKNDRPWRIGIRDPRGAPEDFFAFLETTGGSISTSGDYESYFVLDGVRYHHILDPRTGRPSRGLRSATVLATDATLADALSTAFMVVGKDRALELAGELGVEAVLVDSAGGYHATGAVGDQFMLRHVPAP